MSQVGSTAFNEDSSRSHIVCRFSIEISDRVEQEEEGGEDSEEKIDSEGDVQMRGGDNGKAAHPRTLSYLNLIDLAGSESAKVYIMNDATFIDSVIYRAETSL